MRFYGIHLIALLSELGYNSVVSSEIKTKQPNDVYSWQAEIKAPHLLPCLLNVNTDIETTRFKVKYNDKKIWKVTHPFQIIPSLIDDHGLDQRIPFLMQSLQDLFYEEKIFYEWYKATNLLWYDIEKRIL